MCHRRWRRNFWDYSKKRHNLSNLERPWDTKHEFSWFLVMSFFNEEAVVDKVETYFAVFLFSLGDFYNLYS